MCDVSVETILSLIWHDGDMHLHHVDLQNPLRFSVVLWCWCDGLFPLCHSALTEPAGCSCVDTGVSACLCGCEGEQEETPQTSPVTLCPSLRSYLTDGGLHLYSRNVGRAPDLASSREVIQRGLREGDGDRYAPLPHLPFFLLIIHFSCSA